MSKVKSWVYCRVGGSVLAWFVLLTVASVVFIEQLVRSAK